MSVLRFDASWLAALHARASQPPLSARVALHAGGQTVGSVLPELFQKMQFWLSQNIHSLLLKRDQLDGTFHVNGEPTRALNDIAKVLREQGVGHVAHYWRDEQLGVFSAAGDLLGSVERGAVRPLGIATRAVHLVGGSPDGRIWVQQRSLRKANDPGQWDTLMGGMIAAGDSLHSALARETHEEAGLDVAQLQAVRWGGQVHIQRPTDDDAPGVSVSTLTPRLYGIGYMVEAIDWFDCTVPEGLLPVNQDGEVAQFELLEPKALVERLQRDEFTLEASMILVAALQKQAGGLSGT